jgi:6-phosphogluconolactonase
LVAEEGAELFAERCEESIERHDVFRVALAGGQTPEKLYRHLGDAPHAREIDWTRVRFFWGDERGVGPEDPASNYGMAYRALLSRVPVPLENIFRMPGEAPDPERAAEAYEATLRREFDRHGDGLPRFDLILLGLGPDGHTASLFPGSPTLEEGRRWVAAVAPRGESYWRLTLTLPVINNAAEVYFITTGRGKAGIVERLVNQRDCESLPAGRIHPARGHLGWLLDREAAALLG